MKFRNLILLLILFMSFQAFSVKTQRRFDEEKLDRYRNQPEFKYYKATENQADFYDSYKSGLQKIMESIFGSRITRSIGRNLDIIILVIAALLIILYFRRFNFDKFLTSSDSSLKGQYVQVESVENLSLNDIDSSIDNALKNNDLPIALRLYFIRLLKLLNQQKIIIWEPYKTNYDYIFEIKDEELKQRFKSVARVYEYVWYGHKPININDFEETRKEINSMI